MGVSVAFPGHEIPDPIPEAHGAAAGYPITATFPPRARRPQGPRDAARRRRQRGGGVGVVAGGAGRPAPRRHPAEHDLSHREKAAGGRENLCRAHVGRGRRQGVVARAWSFTTAGEDEGNQRAIDAFLKRLNGYRRAAGVEPMSADPDLSAPCAAHARYMERNFDEKDLNWNDEDASLPGATDAGRRGAAGAGGRRRRAGVGGRLVRRLADRAGDGAGRGAAEGGDRRGAARPERPRLGDRRAGRFARAAGRDGRPVPRPRSEGRADRLPVRRKPAGPRRRQRAPAGVRHNSPVPAAHRDRGRAGAAPRRRGPGGGSLRLHPGAPGAARGAAARHRVGPEERAEAGREVHRQDVGEGRRREVGADLGFPHRRRHGRRRGGVRGGGGRCS